MPETRDDFRAFQTVELRIHGVSNTPPQNTLEVAEDQLVQVAGDADTTIYRVKRGAPTPWPRRIHHRVRAYTWGNLTHGSRKKATARWLQDGQRALWMILLPFAFANVALWAQLGIRAGTREASRTGGPLSYALRLFSLSLTATFSIVAIGVTLDQVVWQWAPADASQTSADVGGTDTSAAVIGWLDFLRDGWLAGNTRTVAVGAIAAATVCVVLGLVARRSFQYEAEISQATEPKPDGVLSHPMSSRWFWRGNRQVRFLSHLHFTVALAVIVALAMWPLRDDANFVAPSAGWQNAALVIICGAVALIVLACAALALPGASERSLDPRFWWVGRALVVTSIALFVVMVGVLVWWPDNQVTFAGEGAPGYDGALTSLATGQALLLVAMWVLSPWTVSNRTAWFGRAPAVFATLGWLLALLYSAVTLFYTADFLNGSGNPAGEDTEIALPLALKVAAASVLPVLVATAAVGVLAFLYLRWRAGVETTQLRAELPPDATHRRARAAAVGRARALHHFMEVVIVDIVGAYVAVMFVFSMFMTGYTIVAGCHGETAGICGVLPDWASGEEAWLSPLAGIGARLLLLLAVLLAVVAAQAYRGGTARRILGMVWDIGTFWPRACHPWAPPCYAERCVPQLVTYVANRDLTDSPTFILAGHSQGVVISVATIWNLGPGFRGRTALLSFGTQLRALYGRVFPSFFGPPMLELLADKLSYDDDGRAVTRWLSLFRKTDPLGYPVFVEGDNTAGEPLNLLTNVDDVPVPDPDFLAPPMNDYVDPPIQAHTDYPSEALYHSAIETLTQRLRAGQRP